MAARISELRLKVEVDGGKLKVLEAGLENVNRKATDLGKKSSTAFSKINQSLGVSTGTVVKFGLATQAVLGGAMAFSVREAIKFESSFAGIRKTVSATEEEFAALSAGMRAMAKEIPIDVNELNAIGEAAGQLGIQTKNILGFTRVMAQLGVTTNLTSTEAANALAQFANITGMAQTDFDRLGSTIVALGNTMATTESKIVDFGLRLAGAGSQVGLSEAQIFAMAAAFSSLGIEAEAGGSAMSKVMIDIAASVESGGERLAQFAAVADMSVTEFSDLFKNDAATAINRFVVGLGSMEKRGMSTLKVLEVMGIEETRMRDALLRAAGAGDLLTKSLAIAEEGWAANNALTKEAEARFQTAASKLTLLWNRVKDFAIVLGDDLLPHLVTMVNRLSDWFDKNQDLIVQDIKNFVTGLETAVENLGTALGALVGDLSSVEGSFNTLGTAVLFVNEGILLFLKGIKAAQEANAWVTQANFLTPGAPNFLRKDLTDEWVTDMENKAERTGKAIDEIEENNRRLALAITNPGGPTGPAADKIDRLPAAEQYAEFEKTLTAISPALAKLEEQYLATNNTQIDFGFGAREAGAGIADLGAAATATGEAAGSAGAGLNNFGGGADGAKKGAKGLADEIVRLNMEIAGIGASEEELIAIEARFKLMQGESAKLVEEWARLSIIRQRGIVGQETLDNLDEMLKGIQEETTAVGLSGIALKKHELAVLAANIEWEKLPKEVAPKVTAAIFGIDKALDNLDAKQTAQTVGENFKQLMESMKTESQKLGETLAANVNLLLMTAAVRPDLIGFEEANALILKMTKETLAEQVQAERAAYIERLKASDSFFDQLKGGMLEFSMQVQTNGELVSQFFADTLSNMSQSFSDLFYNVITGRFDDLKDLAKQTFEAILRAFLDMVSAIATRQIVISIAGAFGMNTKGFAAEDAVGFGQKAVDMFDSGSSAGGAASGGAVYDPSQAVQVGDKFYVEGADGSMVEMNPETGAPAGGSNIGAGIGAGLLGISIGTALGNMINSDMSGFEQGISLGLGAAGAVGGFLIGGPIGAAVGGFIGSIIVPIFSGLFKKAPRLDVDFDSIKTDMGRRAAVVEEFLDPEFFMDSIGEVSVKRKAGLGVGGDDKILELIRERVQESIESIQDIIRRLPTDLFNELNETLLNAEIDIDTVIGGERLLEFDAKGKKVAEKFQAFIEGELPAKFFLAIRESFFDPALQALGVSAEGTEKLIDQFMADMEAAGSREARAAVGAEFLATFSAFVDAFNIVSGNANDAIGQTVQSIESLSAELGFEAVPSIDELRSKLAELISAAEIDPEVVQQYADLRNAIVTAMNDIVSSITGLVGKIDQLNQTIVSLGGTAVDTTGALSQAAYQLQSFLQQEMGNLSLGEQEAFLDQLTGMANEMLAREMAAFEAEHQALVDAGEVQKAEIQGRIDALTQEKDAIVEAGRARVDALNREKDRIQEAFQARIEALNEELRIAEGFKSLTQSIRDTVDSLMLGPQSVLTGVEKVNFLQGEIGSLQRELANTADPEKQLDIAAELRDAFSNLNSAAADAFGLGSPEFVAIFDQVTGGLSGLAEMTEARARTVEEINAEIERLTTQNETHLASIDARIGGAQAQSDAQLQAIDSQIAGMRDEMTAIDAEIAQHTFQASQELQDLFEYIRTEYTRIMEERMLQLEEVTATGFASELEGLGMISGQFEDAIVTLKDQLAQMEIQTDAIHKLADSVSGIPGYASGSGGVRDFGMQTLAFLHGKEAVLTEDQMKVMAQDLSAGMGLVERLANAFTGTHIKDFAETLTGGGMVSGFLERVAGQMSASALMGDQEGLISGLLQNISGRGAISEFADEVAARAPISSLLRNIEAGGKGGAISDLVAELRAGGRQSGPARPVNINITIPISAKASSAAADAALPGQIEEMLIRSIRKGKARKELQKAVKESF